MWFVKKFVDPTLYFSAWSTQYMSEIHIQPYTSLHDQHSIWAKSKNHKRQIIMSVHYNSLVQLQLLIYALTSVGV